MSKSKDKPTLHSSANRLRKKGVTYPPDRWSPSAVSKTRPPTGHVSVDADLSAVQSGPVESTPAPPTEQQARQFLAHRFAAAGYGCEFDYTLSSPGMLVRLDGFDPNRKVGFHYLSHSESDVVSDFGAEEEAELRHLDDAGRAHVLVIHDRDVPSEAELEQRVDEFLARIHKRYALPTS